MKKDPFVWECEPEAEKFLLEMLEKHRKSNAFIQSFEKRLREETSTRLFDWIDHLLLSETFIKQAEACGFQRTEEGYYSHPGAVFPKIQFSKNEIEEGIAIQVESIADFLLMQNISASIEGDLLTGYRKAHVVSMKGSHLWVVERKGVQTLIPTKEPSSTYLRNFLQVGEAWRQRRRQGEEGEGKIMEEAFYLAQKAVDCLGQDVAAHIVLQVERQYWEARNRAGQWQKDRQDALGLGWANHDHHTFRSSRRFFRSLVQLFEILGFHCRERFYAGAQAGWGAQVMENPRAGLVLFLDVDLEPGEFAVDFAKEELQERHDLGTVGLWCALHGDSLFEAGMHHLEAQFSFDDFKSELERGGIGMMKPFSHFSYLKQAFSKGEMWSVKPKRVERLLQEDRITEQQAEIFLREGAPGSHLENLQRDQGYKGFNKDNVSTIIQETDPRKMRF